MPTTKKKIDCPSRQANRDDSADVGLHLAASGNLASDEGVFSLLLVWCPVVAKVASVPLETPWIVLVCTAFGGLSLKFPILFNWLMILGHACAHCALHKGWYPLEQNHLCGGMLRSWTGPCCDRSPFRGFFLGTISCRSGVAL